MNQANVVLGRLISVQKLNVEKLQLRFNWLLSLMLWQEHIEDVRKVLRLHLNEPITQSEYDAKLALSREDWVPLEDIAAFLASQRDWSEDDYEETEEWGRGIKDDAWDAAVAEEDRS